MSGDFDDLMPSFRAAKERWHHAPNLEKHYWDLRRAFEEGGNSILEEGRAFLEMICITIVKELGAELPNKSNPSTPEFLNSALKSLGLEEERGTSNLSKIIKGYKGLADGVSAARDKEGSVAHGKDAFWDALPAQHGRVYLLTVETILSTLLRAYEGVEPSILHTREPPGRYQHHNLLIDEATGVNAEVDKEAGTVVLRFRAEGEPPEEGMEIRTSSSELLYHLDRQAYVDTLNALRGETLGEPESTEEIEEKEKVQESSASVEVGEFVGASSKRYFHSTAASRSFEVKDSYDGKFKNELIPLYEYITHNILDGENGQSGKVKKLACTLLHRMEELAVVDWDKKGSTRSAVRAFVKRLFRFFGFGELGQESEKKLVEWLAKHLEGANSE